MKSFTVQPFGVQVGLTSDPAEFVRWYNKYEPPANRMDIEEMTGVRGMAAHSEDRPKDPKFVLFVAPDHDTATLYHEALHIVHYVMEFHGMPINLESSDTQAHLMEYIVAMAEKKLT